MKIRKIILTRSTLKEIFTSSTSKIIKNDEYVIELEIVSAQLAAEWFSIEIRNCCRKSQLSLRNCGMKLN